MPSPDLRGEHEATRISLGYMWCGGVAGSGSGAADDAGGGLLNGASPGGYAPYVTAFHGGLKEIGFLEGQNVAIEYRWAEGHYDRLRELAADLVRRQVAVIAATGNPSAPIAAKAATATIPIVFSTAGDPVHLGLVASLARPGGNVTGITAFVALLAPKRLELARDLVSTATMIGVLTNRANPNSLAYAKEVQEAASSLGLQTQSFGRQQ